MKLVVTLFLFVLMSLGAIASPEIDQIFDSLKGLPRSYETKGAICEEVAKVLLEKDYPPPRYSVHVGIAYGDLERVIGELDEVIIDHNENKVIKIIEVKCWTDLKAGRDKAHEQRARFLKSIRNPQKLYFTSTSTDQEFSPAQFVGVNSFAAIGQKGAKAVGYDLEFPFTMKELMDLRLQLLRCQNWSTCPKP